MARPMTIRLFVGDCRAKLAGLAPESIHCCVTSPPYWGLRDYGHADQLGLEKTIDEFVAAMVEAFRAVHRVLRADGTLWINLGDCYVSKPNQRSVNDVGGSKQVSNAGSVGAPSRSSDNLAPKNLAMIPARVALALQADGWYLRSVIIWNKPNPMPESVTDRPTTSHEYLYLFAKSESYFYDHEAIKEPQEDGERTRRLREQREGLDTTYTLRRDQMPGQEKPGNTGSVRTAAARQRLAMLGTRNKRTVWTISSQPFKGAHFATFPPTLAETCILAGTSPQCCEYCLAPFVRILGEPEPTGGEGSGNKERKDRADYGGAGDTGSHQAFGVPWQPSISRTLGWRPSCEHDTAKGSARATVLDLFAGAGTTALVAERLGRDSVAVELNPEYAQIIRDRVTDECPLFTEIVEAADDAGVDR
jgi:DNA modification methylase